MADDKVDKKPPASFLALPVSVEKNKEKQGPPSSAVQLVSLWALLNAVVLLGSFAFTYALCQLHITLPSWLREEIEMTGAAAAEARAIGHGQWLPWCIAAQVDAAAVALLLPAASCRRICLALAYVAFTATVATRLILARVVTLFLAANPADIYWWIVGTVDIVTFAAGDIVCFRALHG